MAETTTQIRSASPSFCLMNEATDLIFCGVATELPPNFCTTMLGLFCIGQLYSKNRKTLYVKQKAVFDFVILSQYWRNLKTFRQLKLLCSNYRCRSPHHSC